MTMMTMIMTMIRMMMTRLSRDGKAEPLKSTCSTVRSSCCSHTATFIYHYHYDNAGDDNGDDDCNGDDDDAPVEKDSLGEDFLHSMSGFCVVLLHSVWDLIFMMIFIMVVMMVILLMLVLMMMMNNC